MTEIVTYGRAVDFLNRAEEWLLHKEAENNLILGVAGEIARGNSDVDGNLFLTVEQDGDVVACAFRTPPWKLVITACPTPAIDELVHVVQQWYPDLTAVLGPADTARSFAIAWARRFGLSFRPGMRQRVYRLRAVAAPDPQAQGAPRAAREDEQSLLVDWLGAFYQETGLPLDDPEGTAARYISNGAAWFWCDPEPVGVAVYSGQTRNGVRIGIVFTLPECRGRGYATALTAAMASNALNRGEQQCFLFTDLDNPTSNEIYQRIGFVPVADMVDYLFEQQR